MRITLPLLFASILTVAIASAQGPGFNRVDQTVKDLTEILLLSPQQQDTIRRILEESASTLREAREATGGNREDRMQLMKLIPEKTDAQVENVLSDDQKSKYQEYKKERKERMKEGRPDGRMGPGRGGPRGSISPPR